MNEPLKPPPPPKFERPSDGRLGDLTDEDLEWLEQMERDGRLPNLTLEEAIAEIETDRERFYERLRRAGFDPDEDGDPKE